MYIAIMPPINGKYGWGVLLSINKEMVRSKTNAFFIIFLLLACRGGAFFIILHSDFFFVDVATAFACPRHIYAHWSTPLWLMSSLSAFLTCPLNR